jgi:hypothetical protein
MGTESREGQPLRLLSGPAPVALTQILGVLREPGTEVAKLPGPLGRLGFNEVWVDAIRRVATSGRLDWQVFLVPGVCGDWIYLPKTRRARANRGEPLVRLDIYEPGGEVGARAYSVDDILGGRAVLVFPLFAAHNHELVLGLVPDDVSSVEVRASDMPAQIAKVRDNFFRVEPRVPTSSEPKKSVTSMTTTITWYDAAGKSLKTVLHSTRRALLLSATKEISET